MISITKESLAPVHFESLRKSHRANVNSLVPEIVFCVFLCKGIRRNIGIEQIAAQANVTYPSEFFTWVNGETVPDLALILLTLSEASSSDWGYTIGGWSRGWHLTKKGLRFAKDIERRLKLRGN